MFSCWEWSRRLPSPLSRRWPRLCSLFFVLVSSPGWWTLDTSTLNPDIYVLVDLRVEVSLTLPESYPRGRVPVWPLQTFLSILTPQSSLLTCWDIRRPPAHWRSPGRDFWAFLTHFSLCMSSSPAADVQDDVGTQLRLAVEGLSIKIFYKHWRSKRRWRAPRIWSSRHPPLWQPH